MARNTVKPITSEDAEAPEVSPPAPKADKPKEPDPVRSFVTNTGRQQYKVGGRFFGPKQSIQVAGKHPGPWRVVVDGKMGPELGEHEIKMLANAADRGAVTCNGPALTLPVEHVEPGLSTVGLQW